MPLRSKTLLGGLLLLAFTYLLLIVNRWGVRGSRPSPGLNSPAQTVSVEDSTLPEQSSPAYDSVDIVIACSQPSDASLIEQPSVIRDRDNGELMYTLRAIAQNAPWVRRIHLVVNGRVRMPSWVPEPNKTVMIDRCLLLPKDRCPTRNAYAVQTIIHRIDGLAERFIYLDDDILLCKPSVVADFFGIDGKAVVWVTGGIQEWIVDFQGYNRRSRMYKKQASTGLTTEEIPSRYSEVWHVWVPLLRGALFELEGNYSKWFEFVRSHHRGRYSSVVNEDSTARSERLNSGEEEVQAVWWWWLLKTGRGTIAKELARDPWRHMEGSSSFTAAAWQRVARMCKQAKTEDGEPVIFVNVNDDLPVSPRAEYDEAHRMMMDSLEEMFPSGR